MKLKLKIVMKKVPEGWAQHIYLKVDHHAISKVTPLGRSINSSQPLTRVSTSLKSAL